MSENSNEAEVCTIHFEPACRALLRLASWSFARSQAQGALLASAQGTPENPSGTLSTPLISGPQVEWLYEYAWPSDCLRLRKVGWPCNQTAQGSVAPIWPGVTYAAAMIPGGLERRVNYQITLDKDLSGNRIKVILTNVENAVLTYTSLVDDPNFWDDEFSEAYVFMLASHLVGSLIGDKQMDKDLYAKSQQMALAARAVDANEQPVSPNHTPDFIRARGFALPDSGPWPWPTEDFGYYGDSMG